MHTGAISKKHDLLLICTSHKIPQYALRPIIKKISGKTGSISKELQDGLKAAATTFSLRTRSNALVSGERRFVCIISRKPFSQWSTEVGAWWYGPASLKIILVHYLSLKEPWCMYQDILQEIGEIRMFQQDEDPKLTAMLSQDGPAWPGKSPDLNPVENVLSILNLKVHKRDPLTVWNWRFATRNWPSLNHNAAKSNYFVLSMS